MGYDYWKGSVVNLKFKMEGIKRISLGQNQNELETSRVVPQSSRRLKFGSKKFLIPIAILGILLIWLIVGVALPAKFVYDSARATYEQGLKAYDAVKQQNIELAATELEKTHQGVLETQRRLSILSYTRFVPILGAYYSDVDHLAKAALYGVEAAQITIDAILPYADVLGLKGQGSFVLGSAEERIKKAVETLDKVTPRISEIQEKVLLVKKEVDEVSPDRYPNIRNYKIKPQLIQAKNVIDQTESFVTDARPLIEVLPQLLGVEKEKKYLVIFQNDKELRPTGGFITAYAIFRVEKGRPAADSADDIYTLDGRRTKRVAAPDILRKYLPAVGGGITTEWQMRDANLSPDFRVSMEQVKEFYDQVPGRATVDGIIAVDTQFLVEVVRILGGVDAYGKKFTADTDERCDCPNVVYELSDAITRPVGYVRSGRKDIIGILLSTIMQKSLSSSPRLYWGPLFQAGITALAEKHILLYLYDENAQRGIEALNAGGRIKEYDDDYLHISDANMAGAKSNMYIKETVAQDITVETDGSIVKTLTIDYRNPQPASDCNLEGGGLCLNGILRNVLRVYVARGSELLEHQGFEKGPETYEELGKQVFEGFMTVKPQGKAQVSVKYRLPVTQKRGEPLKLLIQKQPGTEEHEYVIKVNGKEVEKFSLREDREITLRI